jgi:TonB family protein
MKLLRIAASLASVTILSYALVAAVASQEAWQKIAPVGESFTVLMPTRADEATRRIPLSESDWIPERVYYSLANGKRYMVMSFVKTSLDRVPALSSFNNFLRSMEQAFKGSEKEISKSLAFDRDISFEGLIVKQYHVKLGEYPGVARFLGTDKGFYALMAIGADESDIEVARFLSSFALGEVNTSTESSGVIVTTLLDPVIPASGPPDHSSVSLPPEPWPRTVGPIIGGVVNGKAVSLPVPKYPKEARKARESGQVVVQVLIDEQGTVISARVVEGPSSLREAAVGAARKARFTPTRLMGQPVKVNGVIIYNFVGY